MWHLVSNLRNKLNLIFLSLLGGKKGAIQRCPKCKGSGVYVKVHHLGPGFVQKVQSTCRACHGEGERINPKLKCKKCSGEKVQREQKILEIIIDKGMCFFISKVIFPHKDLYFCLSFTLYSSTYLKKCTQAWKRFRIFSSC